MDETLEEMLRAFGGSGTVVVTATGDVHVVEERVMNDNMPEIMYAHFRMGFAGAAATLCAVARAYGYRVGLSLCSPKDQFSRRRGRDISRGRALAGAAAFSFKPETKDDLGGQLRRAFARYLADAKDLPRWAKSAQFLMSVRWEIYEDTAVTMMA